MVDEAKLHQFIGQMLGDLGGAASIAMVRIGDALGLYKALHTKGSMTCAELAQEAGVNERYLREWLSHQAASNYLSYDPASGKFTLPPSRRWCSPIEDSPVYMMGAFDLMASLIDAQPKVQEAFKTGGGVPLGRSHRLPVLRRGAVLPARLPQQSGRELAAGARRRGREACSAARSVADVGCGHGWSTVLMAKAFPNSKFVGYDFHPELDRARAAACRRSTACWPIRGSRWRRPRTFPAAASTW